MSLQVRSLNFQKGVWDPVPRGVSVGEGACRSPENTPFSESPRMALVITSYHKYIQLSSSSCALPICRRIGMVTMLGLELWPGIIIKHAIRVALWTTAAKLLG